MSESHIKTEYGDLICLKPDMNILTMDLVCGEIPSVENDSIVLAFAGAFTGSTSGKGHINIAGNHVSEGKIYRGYRCERNTGAFTWSPSSGPQFFYDDYQSAMEKAVKEGGMGFAQEMMIHHSKGVKTVRKLGNKTFSVPYASTKKTGWLYMKVSALSPSATLSTPYSRKVLKRLFTPTWDKVGTIVSTV